jgi:hypothetical protein
MIRQDINKQCSRLAPIAIAQRKGEETLDVRPRNRHGLSAPLLFDFRGGFDFEQSQSENVYHRHSFSTSKCASHFPFLFFYGWALFRARLDAHRKCRDRLVVNKKYTPKSEEKRRKNGLEEQRRKNRKSARERARRRESFRYWNRKQQPF